MKTHQRIIAIIMLISTINIMHPLDQKQNPAKKYIVELSEEELDDLKEVYHRHNNTTQSHKKSKMPQARIKEKSLGKRSALLVAGGLGIVAGYCITRSLDNEMYARGWNAGWHNGEHEADYLQNMAENYHTIASFFRRHMEFNGRPLFQGSYFTLDGTQSFVEPPL